MAGLYLGIDLGTSNTKVIALSAEGEVRYSISSGYDLYRPQDGYVEQDPNKVVDALVDALKGLAIQMATGDRIVAAGFSSAMHSVLLLDKENTPLTHAVTWADTRSREVAYALKETEEGYAIYRKTGTPIHPMTPLCKLGWFKKNKPALLDRAHRVVSIKEYVFFKLFGVFVVDHSIASATGMFDIFSRKWHAPALSFAGVEESKLSEPVPAGHVLPPLIKPYDTELSAYASTLFCVGASDGCLANYGLGVLDTSHAALTIGTSGAVRVTCSSPATDPEGRLFTYILDDQYYVTGGSINNGGILRQWFRDHMLDGGDKAYEQVLKSAAALPAGSEGLVCLPYLLGERAPHWNSFDKGVYWGITYQHTQAHFLRALLEGVSYTFWQIVSAMEELFTPIESVLATGGFLKSPEWVQILSDVLNKPIKTSVLGDASAIGAAFMAMRASGVNKRPFLSAASGETTMYTPNDDHHQIYTEGLSFFKSLYQKLQPEFEQTNQP